MTRKFLLVAACALTAALVAFSACGGDDDDATDDGGENTPSGTKASPTPSLEGTPGPTATSPAPPVPSIDEAATLLGEGSISAVVQAAIPYPFRPTDLPLEGENTLPDCEQFVFAFGWQVTLPNPPDGVDVIFQLPRESGAVQIADGIAGTAQTGCDTIEIVNRGQESIIVDVHYKIGGVGQ